MSRWTVVSYLTAAVLLSVGAAWYSLGAGLIVAGVCGAVLTTLLLVDVGGGPE